MGNNMMRDIRRKERQVITRDNANLMLQLYFKLTAIALHDKFGMGKQRISQLYDVIHELEDVFVNDTKRNEYDRRASTFDYAMKKIDTDYKRIMGDGEF